ncbi:MAG TPA: hypothetical protein VK858_10320 [Longimicrobiales bacterium]|nr:hypothetical protein [Longimicrobiales bacterium]
MKKALKRLALAAAVVKAPKAMYILRHPIRGTRNLLMLRGARSLLWTRGAALTAAAAATAVAVPMAARMLTRSASD